MASSLWCFQVFWFPVFQICTEVFVPYMGRAAIFVNRTNHLNNCLFSHPQEAKYVNGNNWPQGFRQEVVWKWGMSINEHDVGHRMSDPAYSIGSLGIFSSRRLKSNSSEKKKICQWTVKLPLGDKYHSRVPMTHPGWKMEKK